MSFSLTGVDDEATQRCFAHIHDRVRATLVRGEPVTVAGGHPVRRTLKLLRALARGHWIVGEEYFTSDAACARNRGVAVDPAPFEDGGGDAPARPGRATLAAERRRPCACGAHRDAARRDGVL